MFPRLQNGRSLAGLYRKDFGHSLYVNQCPLTNIGGVQDELSTQDAGRSSIIRTRYHRTPQGNGRCWEQHEVAEWSEQRWRMDISSYTANDQVRRNCSVMNSSSKIVRVTIFESKTCWSNRTAGIPLHNSWLAVYAWLEIHTNGLTQSLVSISHKTAEM